MLRSRMKALSTVTSKSLAETSFQYATETECMAVLREIANDARDLCNQQLAAEAVGLIMELFPPKELNNPETFLEYAVMSIVDFPADVVAKLAHPQHGIVQSAIVDAGLHLGGREACDAVTNVTDDIDALLVSLGHVGVLVGADAAKGNQLLNAHRVSYPLARIGCLTISQALE